MWFDHVIHLAILYLVGTTAAVGWSVVMAYNDTRNSPTYKIKPAPLWVNSLFMAGLTGILGGLGWSQWARAELPVLGWTWMALVGAICLNLGMWGLLFTTTRGRTKK